MWKCGTTRSYGSHGRSNNRLESKMICIGMVLARLKQYGGEIAIFFKNKEICLGC